MPETLTMSTKERQRQQAVRRALQRTNHHRVQINGRAAGEPVGRRDSAMSTPITHESQLMTSRAVAFVSRAHHQQQNGPDFRAFCGDSGHSTGRKILVSTRATPAGVTGRHRRPAPRCRTPPRGILQPFPNDPDHRIDGGPAARFGSLPSNQDARGLSLRDHVEISSERLGKV